MQNALLGRPMPDWTARPTPSRIVFEGRMARLEPLDAARHAAELYEAYRHASDDSDWTFLPIGPFADAAAYRAYAEASAASSDPLHYAVIDKQTQRAIGSLALMRCDAANGVIEVGFVVFSPLLQRTAIATEAQYLLMKYVFDELGYRRYEWKCDSLNTRSRHSAQRLGFQFEGTFRQVLVCKGRNRDTAWFSIIDSEWPTRRAAFERWLAAENFAADGMQRESLTALRQKISVEQD